MIASRRTPFVLAAVLLLMAVPLTGAKAGNADAAKQCQKGGWEALATQSDPFTGFTTQGECVSAAAQGATLTTQLETYVEMSRQPSGFMFMGKRLCDLGLQLVDPPAGSTSATVTISWPSRTLVETAETTFSWTGELDFRDNPDVQPFTAVAVLQPGDVVVPVVVDDSCPPA